LSLGDTFDIAVVALNSFACLSTPEEQTSFLSRVFRHLKRAGMLIVDTTVSMDSACLGQVFQTHIRGPLPDGLYGEYHFTVTDLEPSLHRGAAECVLDLYRNGRLVRSVKEVHWNRFAPLDETVSMLERAGFRIVVVDRYPPGKNAVYGTDRALFRAVRP
jgi:hypothetical protein